MNNPGKSIKSFPWEVVWENKGVGVSQCRFETAEDVLEFLKDKNILKRLNFSTLKIRYENNGD